MAIAHWLTKYVLRPVAAGVFAAWSIAKIAFNAAGTVDMIDDPATTAAKLANWLFQTPWWVPSIATAIVVAALYWPEIRNLLSQSEPVEQKKLPPLAVPAGSRPTYFHHLIPDLRLADSVGIQRLFSGHERQKIIALLVAEKLTAWARPMGPRGDPDLIRLSGQQWETHSVFWYPPSQGAISQTFFRTKARDESKFYDVHLNSVQIRQIWPDLNLSDVYIPLYEAAKSAYEQTIDGYLADMARRHDADRSDSNIITYYCYALETKARFFGERPPSERLEIYSDRVHRNDYNITITDDKKVIAIERGGSRRWINLCVLENELHEAITKIREIG